MDDQPGRTPPPGKPQRGRRGKRNPGKQPGAPGSHLAWSENPDRTVPHFPRGACACGADLAGAADLGVAASHQEVEIPEMAAAVIQHDVHEVACRISCGWARAGAYSDEPSTAAIAMRSLSPASMKKLMYSSWAASSWMSPSAASKTRHAFFPSRGSHSSGRP